MEPDIWAMWPDDFMCPRGEIEQWLNPPCARSDDYFLVEVIAYGGDGTPSHWKRYAPEAPPPDA